MPSEIQCILKRFNFYLGRQSNKLRIQGIGPGNGILSIVFHSFPGEDAFNNLKFITFKTIDDIVYIRKTILLQCIYHHGTSTPRPAYDQDRIIWFEVIL